MRESKGLLGAALIKPTNIKFININQPLHYKRLIFYNVHMPRGFKLSKNLTRDTLLKIAAVGIITVAAATSPFVLRAIVKSYFKEKSKEMARKRARKLAELRRRKLIEFKEMADGSLRITLSYLGKKAVRHYKLDEMKLKIPQKWDRQWRIIMYDIPSRQRKASDAFRKKIKEIGLYQLQKSVWVSPYDCLAELEFLCTVFEIDIDKNIYYFRTAEIPKEKDVREFFNL